MSDDPALDKLSKQIQEAKKATRPSSFKNKSPQNLAGRFFNAGIELVAGVVVGTGLGIFIDWIFGTSPWGLISLFILGSIAGMLNVYRAVSSKQSISHKKDTHV